METKLKTSSDTLSSETKLNDQLTKRRRKKFRNKCKTSWSGILWFILLELDEKLSFNWKHIEFLCLPIEFTFVSEKENISENKVIYEFAALYLPHFYEKIYKKLEKKNSELTLSEEKNVASVTLNFEELLRILNFDIDFNFNFVLDFLKNRQLFLVLDKSENMSMLVA